MEIYPDIEIEMIGEKGFLKEVRRICKENNKTKLAFLCSGDSYALKVMQ